MATATLPSFPALTSDEHADVCIVGAGIAGLTTGYLLARAGKSVVILDDGPIVSGETERTTAHLVTALDDRYFELERLHGENGTKLAAESHAAAIDAIERIVREEQIECDFERVDGYLFNAPDQPQDLLDRELEAVRRSGLTTTKIVDRAPLASFNTGRALLFPRQAQFHPLKYLAALAQAIVREGGRIFAQTHAAALTPEQFRVTQQNATERPGTGTHLDNEEPGIYVDIVSGEPLFASSDKFESGCGWPSFTKPVVPAYVNELRDTAHGMVRTEVRSTHGDSHLGHVFSDGPADRGGLRYCINSASLRFVHRDDMEAEGYSAYLDQAENVR